MEFKELVKKLSPTVKRIAYKLNGFHRFFDSEDLYQEALVHLWHDFNAGKLNDKTDSYILQGCYFHLKNYIRKKRSKAVMVSLEAVINNEDGYLTLKETIVSEEANHRSYLDNLNDRLLAETIRNNGFTPREKAMLGFFSEGFTTREIGGRLGISHVMVIKMMSKVREKCRQYIE
ncbi:MAG: sigma-70 family RNA polymerase sigma factor [Candidatus Omnitrophica bacterium]|nr:sigma-70 family RNA polymerase sigma factor [Candidatus Omnitrophota bacterium]